MTCFLHFAFVQKIQKSWKIFSGQTASAPPPKKNFLWAHVCRYTCYTVLQVHLKSRRQVSQINCRYNCAASGKSLGSTATTHSHLRFLNVDKKYFARKTWILDFRVDALNSIIDMESAIQMFKQNDCVFNLFGRTRYNCATVRELSRALHIDAEARKMQKQKNEYDILS